MCKIFFWILIYISAVNVLMAQQSNNIDLVSHVILDEDSSDIWGFEDRNGNEYVVIGVKSGIKIFQISDPENPVLVKHIRADNSIWRDIKSYGNYLYAVADQGNDGLMVINMSNSPDTINYFFINRNVSLNNLNGKIERCHNLYIDELGFMFLAGCNIGRRGVIIARITEDSLAIEPIAITNSAYSHDVYTNKNLMYSSDVFDGALTIYNIEERSNPRLVSSIQTGNLFTHNAWSSDNNEVVFTTDEVEGAYVEAYDISNLDDVQFLDKIRSNRANSSNVIVHNVHFLNEYLITSHYTEGITITDASDPSNLVEVGYFDPFESENLISGRWFDGCWGVYPFFNSGLIAMSDISNGLYILKPKYLRAGKIEGKIISSQNKNAIRNAEIYFSERSDLYEISDLKGEFKTGTIGEGNFNLIVDHPLYDIDTTNIELNGGDNSSIIIELKSQNLEFNFISSSGEVLDDLDLRIEDIKSKKSIIINSTDNGQSIPMSNRKTYNLIISKWGYKEYVIKNFQLTENTILNIELLPGFEDSFIFENQWNSTSQASSGKWERGTPIQKSYGGKILQPNHDSPNDEGNMCYFTELQGGGSNSGDVDNGFVVLQSPFMVLDTNSIYEISYDYWFSNERGSIPPNDSLIVSIDDGSSKSKIHTIKQSSEIWHRYINDLILKGYSNDSFRIEVIAYDKSPTDHVMEAGFDNFKLNVKTGVSTNQINNHHPIRTYPNPFISIVNIDYFKNRSIDIYVVDVTGKIVYSEINTLNRRLHLSHFKNGIYFILIKSGDEVTITSTKIIKL